jgi:hypothetical protein
MKWLPLVLVILAFTVSARADLADSCSITDRTACVLNSDQNNAQFFVALPNYIYCGIKLLADVYPNQATLADFQAGLYVTAGPRWDQISEQVGVIQSNLIYPLGTTPLLATFLNVYTRNGQTLNDYVHAKLGTSYRANPTVMLVTVACPK